MAAWKAALARHGVVVLERAAEPGGMAASFEVAGVRVDLGSHRLHPSAGDEVLGDLRQLLGDDLQVRPRNGRLRLGDRWVAFPLRAGDLIRKIPPSFAARAARDMALAPFRRHRDQTFADVVRARLGPTVAADFYDPYVRKLWGTPPEELSGELARRRVATSSAADLLRRVRRAAEPAGGTFLYPRRGFGQIAERLADAATAAGADIRLDSPVQRVRLADDETVVVLADGSEVRARMVWSTLPIPVLARITSPHASWEARAAASRLRHRALVLVYLVLDLPRYTPFDAHYLPALDVPVARLSEPKNYRDGDDPPDRTVLCAEVPCWQGDETWLSPPEVLGEMVAESLERSGLPPVRPVQVETRRLPRVYPVYHPGFEQELAALERWAGSQHRLLTFGRQGLFVPDNTHHALAMGRAAAAALRADGSFSRAAWAEARERFRTHVVED